MEMYLHVRVLFTILLGLGVSRLLSGVAQIVQHPKAYKVYCVHLLWALFLFLYLIHFWWWEYRLQAIQQWSFPLYFFIAMYAVVMFLLCVLFFFRADGGVRQLQSLLLFPAAMDIQLDDYSVFGRHLGYRHQGQRVLARDRTFLLRTNRPLYFLERGRN
jgi:hypothetical protein